MTKYYEIQQSMKIKLLTGIEKVVKINSSHKNKINTLIESHNKSFKNNLMIEKEEVLNEIIKILGGIDSSQYEYNKKIDLTELKNKLDNGDYKIDIQSLADNIIDIL